MSVTYKTTHREEALADFIQQFKGKEKLAAWLLSYVAEAQELEDTLADVQAISDVDTATGAQLDLIGAIVGEERQGRTDLDYRTAIKVRIRLNLSQGTLEDIRALIRGVAGDVDVKFFEFYPAGFVAQILDAIDPLVVDPTRIGNFVKSGKAAGVDAQTAVAVTPAFQFDTGSGFDLGKYGAIF